MSSALYPPRNPAQHGNAAPVYAPNVPTAPAGTFASGTKVQVGASRVVIERYLSEGGFAHVYLVKLPQPISGTDRAVLKRVAVPDKEALANMRTEVETMKKLKGHKQIVTYFDSHASQLKGGGYEVFLLMEYCSGGGLIDFMNTRLQNRLTEPEILKIFSDTAQGVACMHYLKPPLLHRDLKVENILINDNGPGGKQFKLCDFGSAAPPRPAAKSAAEGRLIEEDVQKHTTMQYRSPEMIDVYRKQPIDEKADIWALGVLLYKLCYYTTPFEEQGQMAILNASFRFPGYPQFSDKIKKLIAMMLQEKPTRRPNIYQVLQEVCSMRGTQNPFKDIYSGRTASEARMNQELPPPPGQIASPPVVGAYKTAPVEEKVQLPEITPMRRGRPTSNLGFESHQTTQPSPSPRRPVGRDPFAALDSNTSGANPEDEIAARFPSLDQFSLLHESGSNFDFDQPKSGHQRQSSEVPGKGRDISQRVTEALADEAFAVPVPAKKDVPTHSKSVPNRIGRNHAGTQTVLSPPSPKVTQPPKKSTMISTGTMTSPSEPALSEDTSISSRPIFRFPPNERSTSQPRVPPSPQLNSTKFESSLSARPSLSEHRSKSQTFTVTKAPTSSRPSLEASRPSAADLDAPLQRARSTATPRSRPVSTHLETAAAFIKGRSSSRSKDTAPSPSLIPMDLTGKSQEGGNISSNVDFLRAMEEEDQSKRSSKRMSSGSKHGHGKRSSMPSVSLSGTKNLLAGRFGDAFKRFEHNGPDSADTGDDAFPDSPLDSSNPGLTPITGSVATDGRSDDGQVLEETEEMSPEMRRELERRRLSQEERRVADAAAKYKQGLGGGPPKRDASKAASIQNKVQALLDESSKQSPTKTAAGYGRWTSSPVPMHERTPTQPERSMPSPALSKVPSNPQPHQDLPLRSSSLANPPPPASAPPTERPALNRPSAPPKPQPKPQALRTGGTGGPNPPIAAKPSNLTGNAAPGKLNFNGRVREAQQGLGIQGAGPQGRQQPQQQGGDGVDEDWETSFTKKYPSLAGLEMVETEISTASGARDKGVRDI